MRAAGGNPVTRRPNRLLVGVSVAIVVVFAAIFAVLALRGPGTCPGETTTVEATATATELTPSQIRACRGQQVTLRVTSEWDGELHIHGIDAEIEVRRGVPAELHFVAEPSGQYAIEGHPADGGEREIGVLIVDEP